MRGLPLVRMDTSIPSSTSDSVLISSSAKLQSREQVQQRREGGGIRRWDKVNKRSQRNQKHSKQVQHPRNPPGPGEVSLESDCTLLGYLSV